MTDNRKESTEFIESLKQAGIAIHNENAVVERLAEAREWHSAFLTLVRAGKRIGIWFGRTAALQSANLQRLFAQFRFSPSDESIFEAALEG